MPVILQQDDISIILEFFSRDEDQGQDEVCNMERFLVDDALPLKSDNEIECFQLATFSDFNKYKDEIIDYVCQRDKAKENNGKPGKLNLLKKEVERNIAVEHTYMDFQFMIIGEKLAYNLEENKNQKFVFDDLYLSKLMIQNEDNVEFYQQDAIQKIIDYQFVTTKKFFSTLMYCYIAFFMLPIIIIIFSDDPSINQYCYVIAYFAQLGFFGYEII